MFYNSEEDWFMESWLERNYSGGPDECGQCYREGNIIKLNDCKKH